MSTNDNERQHKDEDEDGDESPQEIHQTKDIDLKNHPVDVQKKPTSTVDATIENIQDVELGEENAPSMDDKLQQEDLEPQSTPIEPATTSDPLELVGNVITTVCPVVEEANASVPVTNVSPPKKCACGSTKHLRRNHRDCPLNPKLLEKKKASSTSNEQSVTNNTASVSSSRCGGTIPSKRSDPLKSRSPGGKGLHLPHPSSDEETVLDERVSEDGSNSNKESDEESSGSKSSATVEPKYYRPSFHRLTNDDFREKRYSPVIDISSPEFKNVQTIFKKMKRGTGEEIPPTAAVMVDHYFDDDFVDNIVNSSNAYAFERRRREPSLSIWKNKRASKQITASDINHFIALLYYFGIVQLPSKRDYWSKNHHWMPSHPICCVNGMTRDRYEYLWRHFHCNCATDDDFTSSTDDVEEENNDEELIELQVERVQRDQEAQIGDDEDPNLDEDETPETEESGVWYEKIKPLVDHMREKSQDLIFVLGTFLALDEMMIRFMGRSKETHRMKNKPIKEGFKFFVLAITTGFVVNFSPDG